MDKSSGLGGVLGVAGAVNGAALAGIVEGSSRGRIWLARGMRFPLHLGVAPKCGYYIIVTNALRQGLGSRRGISPEALNLALSENYVISKVI